MSTLNDAYIAVAPDGYGKKVKNVQLQMIVPDSTSSTGYSVQSVYAQVVGIQDEFGNQISEFVDYVWQAEMLKEMKRIRRCLTFLATSEQSGVSLAAVSDGDPMVGRMGFDPDVTDEIDDQEVFIGSSMEVDEIEPEEKEYNAN